MNHQRRKRAALFGTLSFLVFLLGVQPASAAERVSGYVKSNGTRVAPYYRTNRDGDFYNNWSTKGNVNPYTGAAGSRLTPPSGAEVSTRSKRSYSTPYVPNYSAPEYVAPPMAGGQKYEGTV